jgi:hypothetical protein
VSVVSINNSISIMSLCCQDGKELYFWRNKEWSRNKWNSLNNRWVLNQTKISIKKIESILVQMILFFQFEFTNMKTNRNLCVQQIEIESMFTKKCQTFWRDCVVITSVKHQCVVLNFIFNRTSYKLCLQKNPWKHNEKLIKLYLIKRNVSNKYSHWHHTNTNTNTKTHTLYLFLVLFKILPDCGIWDFSVSDWLILRQIESPIWKSARFFTKWTYCMYLISTFLRNYPIKQKS